IHLFYCSPAEYCTLSLFVTSRTGVLADGKNGKVLDFTNSVRNGSPAVVRFRDSVKPILAATPVFYDKSVCVATVLRFMLLECRTHSIIPFPFSSKRHRVDWPSLMASSLPGPVWRAIFAPYSFRVCREEIPRSFRPRPAPR